MKDKKNHKKTVKRIQKALSCNSGLLKPAGYSVGHKPMLKGEYMVEDNDELMFIISSLLNTCLLALEGEENVAFGLSGFSKASRRSHVTVALEFVIKLLPRDQIIALDEITEILSQMESPKAQP